jgi:beta-lactamase regulating signal transducer with metallopeptidase domain
VTISVSVLFLLACAIHGILGRRRVLIRSGLWNAVLLAAIIQPVAALSLPRFRVGWLSVSEPSRNAEQTLVSQGISASSNARLHDNTGLAVTTETSYFETAEPVAPDSRRPGKGPGVLAPILSMLMGIYSCGVLILVIRLGASLRGVSRLKRNALLVDDPSWTEALSRWRNRLGLFRPATLVRSDQAQVPLLLGWFRPMIVLPLVSDESAAIPASQIDAVLVHELAHLRRGDDVWNLLQQVAQILYWPHPLVWLAVRMIAGVREQACDDLCVRLIGGEHDYRAALVAVASRLTRSTIPPIPISLGQAMSRASSASLLRRLSWIEQTGGASSCLLNWPGRLTIAFVVLGVAIALSTIELTHARAAGPSLASAPLGHVSADNAPPVHAYNEPVPNSAKYHTVTLTVLDD